MKSLFSHVDFRRIIYSQTTSAFGDWMATVALMALVLDVTQSSTAVAGILVLRLLPTTIAGPLAARLVYRWDRRRLMMAMDLVRLGIVAVIPFLDALWWIYMWAFLLEVASLVFLPARDAAIPELAGEGSDLDTANSLVLASSYATIPFAAAGFGLISAIGPAGTGILGNGPAFWFDALTFLVSFEFIRRITSIPSYTPEERAAEEQPSFRRALRIPLVRAVLPAVASAALGIGALFSLGIVFVRDILHASNTQFGILVALFGVGAGIGLGALQLVDTTDIVAVRAAVLFQGAVISLMSMAPNLSLTFLGAAGFGAGASAALAAGMSYIQNSLEGNSRVLAFAGFHIVIRAGLALAAIGAGVAADLVGNIDWPVVGRLPSTRLVLFWSGIIVMAGALLARSGIQRLEDDIDTTVSTP